MLCPLCFHPVEQVDRCDVNYYLCYRCDVNYHLRCIFERLRQDILELTALRFNCEPSQQRINPLKFGRIFYENTLFLQGRLNAYNERVENIENNNNIRFVEFTRRGIAALTEELVEREEKTDN